MKIVDKHLVCESQEDCDVIKAAIKRTEWGEAFLLPGVDLSSLESDPIRSCSPIANVGRSAVETWEFYKARPQVYTVYVQPFKDDKGQDRNVGFVTTWTGQRIGRFSHNLTPNRGVGGKWYAIDISSDAGDEYYGRYYSDNQQCVTIRKRKGR